MFWFMFALLSFIGLINKAESISYLYMFAVVIPLAIISAAVIALVAPLLEK